MGDSGSWLLGYRTKSDITFSFCRALGIAAPAVRSAEFVTYATGGSPRKDTLRARLRATSSLDANPARPLSLKGGQTVDPFSAEACVTGEMRPRYSRTRTTTFPLAVRFSSDATAAAACSSG